MQRARNITWQHLKENKKTKKTEKEEHFFSRGKEKQKKIRIKGGKNIENKTVRGQKNREKQNAEVQGCSELFVKVETHASRPPAHTCQAHVHDNMTIYYMIL
jgi:hypothetical protein